MYSGPSIEIRFLSVDQSCPSALPALSLACLHSFLTSFLFAECAESEIVGDEHSVCVRVCVVEG